MTTGLALYGGALHNSELELILKDLLAGKGDAITSDQGTLAWCEAYMMARMQANVFSFYRLLFNQFDANTMSIMLKRQAAIYGLSSLSDPNQIRLFISLKQSFVGTPPTADNVSQVLTTLLGNIFIGFQWNYQIQYKASAGPTTGNNWYSPLSTMYVYIWQPRDNENNTLIPDSIFQKVYLSWRGLLNGWLPAHTPAAPMELRYAGNSGNGSLLSITAGSTIVTGFSTTTKFLTDFHMVNDQSYRMPLQVVDDNNNLQTYTVASVQSDTQMTLATPAVANITERTYRTLGIPIGAPGGIGYLLIGQ